MNHKVSRPAGPSGLPLLGSAPRLARDPLGFLTQLSVQYGDFVYLNLYGFDVYLVTSPDAINEVLVAQHDSFVMDRLSRKLSDYIGNSLLISDGPFWEQQRRRVSGAFSARRVAEYKVIISDLIEEEADTWLGVQTDVSKRMGILTLTVLTRTALGMEYIDDFTTVIDSVNVLAKHVMGIRGTGIRLPYKVPTPANLAARRSLRQISTIISARSEDLIAMEGLRPFGEHSLHLDKPTVLSLLSENEASAVPGISAEQVRDELVTMLLVGHETTAQALTFACWLLATHPTIQDEIADGLRSIDSEQVMDADYPPIELLGAVVQETLRLYPPVPAFGREVTARVNVAGYELHPKAQVIMAPWIMHRNPEWFPDPERFEPRRWLDNPMPPIPRYAYMPFGGGIRRCLGSSLALVEITTVLAALIKRYELRPAADEEMSVYATVTLRPRRRISIIFNERI